MHVSGYPLKPRVEEALKELLERLRPRVRDLRGDVRVDSVGDLAVFVLVVLSEPPAGRATWSREDLRTDESTIREAIHRKIGDMVLSGFEVPFVYLSFRLESEQKMLDDAGTGGA